MTLPQAFLARPIAHRGLHDRSKGIPENSLAAIRAAAEAGYGIEIDLQPSSDGQAMVFHDYTLDRMTGETGPIRQRGADELQRTGLAGGDDGIPTLAAALEAVRGRVPLLIEIKDQDGALGPDVGTLERATAAAIANYKGDIAVMSFNPHSVALMAELAPGVPRGLTTEDFVAEEDWRAPIEEKERLTGIPDYDRVGACFISHNRRQLDMPRVAELKRAGAAILCWTVRSPAEEALARKVADTITFEGYSA